MADQAEQPVAEHHEEEEEDNPNYVPPAQKSIDEIINADADDESLRKYKEALLGSVAGGAEQIIIGESQPTDYCQSLV